MVLRNFELWRNFAKEASNALTPLINFFCAVHVTRTYALDIASVPGPSMLPTINISGDIVLVDRISHRFSKIVPGDIVIVVSPENPRKVITKRLIAVEDNTVTYLVDPKNSDKRKSVEVPKGHLWVQGDNIYSSRDSRDFGPVPYGLLYGKVFWRVSCKIINGLFGRGKMEGKEGEGRQEYTPSCLDMDGGKESFSFLS